MSSWENNIRRVEPYVPGEQPKEKNIIKLNTNENPYPPSPKVSEALREFNTDRMKLYPDPDSAVLIDALAERYKVKPSRIFVGVGSDDVLSMAFMTFFNSDKPILFPDITYSFYDVWAEVYRVPYKRIPLDSSFRINPSDYMNDNGGIIFPNPNAPTGVFESVSVIEEIVKANPQSVVIIDEAYIDFGGQSCLPLVDKYDNLLVVQTFSKSRSMAGMRIGHITQICGAAAVEDEEYFRVTVNKIIAAREKTKARLSELGFSFPDSMSNFIFASHCKKPACKIFEELKSRRIFVRYWNKPEIDNYLRITIGTENEMDYFIKALEEILL